MAHELHKVRVRIALKPRREPYWGAPLARGRFLGLRKIDAQRATWIARLRNEHGVQKYKSLGYLAPDRDFDQAKDAALGWFKATEGGVQDTSATVEQACREYVEYLRKEKGEATATDADMRFTRTVYGRKKASRRSAIPANSIARVMLDRIRKHHISKWRDGLELDPASSNRTLTALRAALNLAVADRKVSADRQIEWTSVKRLKDSGKRRTLFLDLKQRRALVGAANGATRDLIEAAATTGARPGELIAATCSQFDVRTKSMTFNGKTGTRTVPLSPAALRLFTRLSRRKLPLARLLVRDDGKPWAHSDWDQLVREAAKAAKLPSSTVLYTLRHSFITQAITDGMTTLDVARLCGTSVGMIEKHYGHLVASSARERLAAVAML